MTVVLREVTVTGGTRQDRHHAGNTAAASNAQEVLAQAGIEGGAPERAEYLHLGAHAVTAEQPFRDAPAGFFLDDEFECLAVALVIHHRPAAKALHARHLDQHELAGVEFQRLPQFDRKVDHVVRQCSHGRDTPAQEIRRAGAGLHRLHEAGYFDDGVRPCDALAHQEFVRALQVFTTGRLRPQVGDLARQTLCLAGAAGAAAALIGQIDGLAEAAMENVFIEVGFEVMSTISGIYLNFHRVARSGLGSGLVRKAGASRNRACVS